MNKLSNGDWQVIIHQGYYGKEKKMDKLYNATEIGKMIGVSSETIKAWERKHLVPTGNRLGLRKKRVWNRTQVKLILEFARDYGYPIPEGFSEGK